MIYRSGEIDRAEEVSCTLIVAGSDGAKLRQFGKEIPVRCRALYKSSSYEQSTVLLDFGRMAMVSPIFAEMPWLVHQHQWLCRQCSCPPQVQAAGHRRGQDHAPVRASEESLLDCSVRRMDLRVNPLCCVRWIPAHAFPFAPALCWWAWTIVKLIMAYSLLESPASHTAIRFQTPLWL